MWSNQSTTVARIDNDNEDNDVEITSANNNSEKFNFNEPFKIATPPKINDTHSKSALLLTGGGGSGGEYLFKFEKPIRINGLNTLALKNNISFSSKVVLEKPKNITAQNFNNSELLVRTKNTDVVDRRHVLKDFSSEANSSQTISITPSSSQSRDSSSNSILAALKSLGTNKFNSIFIKPKSNKHIEQSMFFTKKLKTSEDSAIGVRNNFSNKSLFESNKLLSILPDEPKEIKLDESVEELLKRFSSENINLLKFPSNSIHNNSRSNSPVTDNDNDDDEIELDPTKPNKSSTSTGALNSQKYPMLNLNRTLFNYKAKSKLKSISDESTLLSNPLSHHHLNQNNNNLTQNSSSSRLIPKWTCLICLSKHFDHVSICSVCGSSKPASSSCQNHTNNCHETNKSSSIFLVKNRYSNLNQSKSMLKNKLFSSYLLNQLGYTSSANPNNTKSTTNHIVSAANQLSKLEKELDPTRGMFSSPGSISSSSTSSSASQNNPYLRKWTCRYCNFSNDSLKIVCLNCRWVKTCTTEKTASTSVSPSVSRLIIRQLEKPTAQMTSSEPQNSSDTVSVLRKDDEESSGSGVCATCKSPIKEANAASAAAGAGTTTDEATSVVQQQQQNVAPPPPPVALPSLSQLFGGASKKWTCDTCLVSNVDTADKCVSCSAVKPGGQKQTTPTTLPQPILIPPLVDNKNNNETNIEKNNEISLKTLLGNRNTWKCDTCLAQNDNEKLKCACCQSEKPSKPGSSEKTTPSTIQFPSTIQNNFPSTLQFPSILTLPAKPLETAKTSQLNNTVPPILQPLSTNNTQTLPNSSTSTSPLNNNLSQTQNKTTTDANMFKINFQPMNSNHDSNSNNNKNTNTNSSQFKLPVFNSNALSTTPASAIKITPFNLAPTPIGAGFNPFPSNALSETNNQSVPNISPFANSQEKTATTTQFKPFTGFTSPLASSVSNNSNTTTKTPELPKINFSNVQFQTTPPSNTTASLFKPQQNTSNLSPFNSTSTLQQPQQQQLPQKINFNFNSNVNNQTQATTTTTTAAPVPSIGFNFQSNTTTPSLFTVQKRPNTDNSNDYSPSKIQNTNNHNNQPIFPLMQMNTSGSGISGSQPSSSTNSFILNTPVSFPSINTTNSSPNAGSMFNAPFMTPAQTPTTNMFQYSGAQQQQQQQQQPMKLNFSPGSFNFNPQSDPNINFTSTDTPFRFSGANEPTVSSTNELRKFRRATRRNFR